MYEAAYWHLTGKPQIDGVPLTRMCNLYSITTNQAPIIALFRVINRYVGNLPPMSGGDAALQFKDHIRHEECPQRQQPILSVHRVTRPREGFRLVGQCRLNCVASTGQRK